MSRYVVDEASVVLVLRPNLSGDGGRHCAGSEMQTNARYYDLDRLFGESKIESKLSVAQCLGQQSRSKGRSKETSRALLTCLHDERTDLRGHSRYGPLDELPKKETQTLDKSRPKG